MVFLKGDIGITYQVPINSGSGNLIQFPVPFAASTGLQDFEDPYVFTGFEGYYYAQVEQAILMYAAEIWQKTAARDLWAIISLPIAVSGNYVQVTQQSEMCMVALSLSQIGAQKRTVIGTPDIINCGYLAFRWAGRIGKLHPIRFAQSIFFPESWGADSVQLFLNPNVVGTMTQYSKTVGGTPVQLDTGVNESWALAGQPTANVNTSAKTVPVGYAPWQWIAPVINSSGLLASSLPINSNLFETSLLGLSEGPWYTALLGYLCESWESECLRGRFASQDVGTISGTGMISSNGATPVGLQLDGITPMNKTADSTYGASGANYYGIIAWQYGTRYGELCYINGPSCFTAPYGLSATGFAYWLKPGFAFDFSLNCKQNPVQGLTVSAQGGSQSLNFRGGNGTGLFQTLN